jgi:hypothetical protein
VRGCRASCAEPLTREISLLPSDRAIFRARGEESGSTNLVHVQHRSAIRLTGQLLTMEVVGPPH